ncbi:MAG: DUF2065 domain-containing protein [Pseudomonadota bacterium]|nr:DUF2065 domain-containing protein [Pseudomonadota bacterium]
MSDEIWVAGCLILVIEGLLLAAIPVSWQRVMLELASVDPKRLRIGGIVAMLVGLVCLKLVKG